MRMSKRAVDSLEPGPRDLFLWDTDIKGFGVKVTPAGRKVYLLQYRMGGRQAATKRWTIGPHGSPWTPDTARQEAIRIQMMVRQGIDPRMQERKRRQAAVSLQFEDYAELFIERYLKTSWRASWVEGARILRAEAVPAFKGMALPDIGRRELSTLLDSAADRPGIARLLFAILRKLFNWCVERGDIQVSPIVGMRGPPLLASRERTLTDVELIAVWQAAEGLNWPFGPIVHLLIATAARRDEVASMEWRELDLGNGRWTIPGSKIKNGKAHIIPLNAVAIAILERIPRQSPGMLFTTTGKTAPSGFSKAKIRLDMKVIAVLRNRSGHSCNTPDEAVLPPWRIHDLRRTVATNMQRLGVRFEVTEAILNHLSGSRSGVAGIYQRHDWAAEKKHALDLWNERLDSLLSDMPAVHLRSSQ